MSHFVGSLLRFFGFLAGISTACGVGYLNLTDDMNKSFLEVQNALTILRKDVLEVIQASQSFALNFIRFRL